ncbi:hypothetical protein LXL04_011366 [Taraxacum kok-saghyz]
MTHLDISLALLTSTPGYPNVYLGIINYKSSYQPCDIRRPPLFRQQPPLCRQRHPYRRHRRCCAVFFLPADEINEREGKGKRRDKKVKGQPYRKRQQSSIPCLSAELNVTVLDEIRVVTALSKKGILVANTGCQFCPTGTDDTKHFLIRCPLAVDSLRWILDWCGIPWQTFSSVVASTGASNKAVLFGKVGTGKRKKSGEVPTCEDRREDKRGGGAGDGGRQQAVAGAAHRKNQCVVAGEGESGGGGISVTAVTSMATTRGGGSEVVVVGGAVDRRSAEEERARNTSKAVDLKPTAAAAGDDLKRMAAEPDRSER